jgi:hypothetical protein
VKTRLFFTFLVLSLSLSVAMAKTHPKVTEFALKHCNHEIFPNEDDRIDCVTDIVNCVIVDGGETDLTKLNSSCILKASKRRIYEQQRK